MEIRLIYPSVRRFGAAPAMKNQSESLRYPGMGLTMVAALTPRDWRVSILDDERETLSYDDRADLVGLSLLTCNARRGYEIAREYRKRGVPVVLGGMHVTACPDEAEREADAIVVGEAEDTWPGLLKDFAAGALKRIYRSSNSSSLAGLPVPRRDLLKKEGYITVNTVQATRGCPFNCEFCSITALLGGKTRCRPIEEVVEEVRGLEGGMFVLNDDNVAQEHDYFKELFRRLIPLRKKWAGNASWNIAKDAEMMDLMERSGCVGVFVGFESIFPQERLAKVIRGDNRAAVYLETVRKLHARRICVIGAFIFGFDNDDASVFERTFEFALESRIDTAQINILVPYPGTPLHARLEREGRIVERDWNRYMTDNVCFKPRHMSREVLREGCVWASRKFFSYPRIGLRVLRAWPRAPLKATAAVLAVNLAFRQGIADLPRRGERAGFGHWHRDGRHHAKLGPQY